MTLQMKSKRFDMGNCKKKNIMKKIKVKYLFLQDMWVQK